MTRPPRVIVPAFDPPANPEPELGAEVETLIPTTTSPDPDAGDVQELADQRFTDYTWSVWRQRTADEIARTPKGGPRSFVTRIVGPVDIVAFQQQHGGGIYEFWAYLDVGDGNGKRFRFKQVYPLDGPRKDAQAAPPAPAPATATDPALAATLSGIARTLERLESRTAAPPAAAAPPFPIKEVIELSKLIGQRERPEPAPALGASVTELMGLINQGIELGKSTQPGSEPSTVAVVIEKLSPAIERIAAGLLARRAPPPRRPAGEAVPSTAQVISDPEPAQPSDDEVRMSAAIDALARAVIDQTPPDDFAFVLEHILSREQVAMLRLGSTEQVIGQLTAAGMLTRYPILATESAAPYLESVLTELRNPAQEGGDDSEVGP